MLTVRVCDKYKIAATEALDKNNFEGRKFSTKFRDKGRDIERLL